MTDCTHNNMIERPQDPKRAWQCADCGYVYGGLITLINGTPADWTPEIWRLWHTYVDEADPQLLSEGRPYHANYFTPRPWQNEYDHGSRQEGFTFIWGRQRVSQVITNGVGRPFIGVPATRPTDPPTPTV